ncbi:prospero homeobox protein 1-like [Scophthalmus maximus]|nr:prospero homeobox protein 1-like [Scophthalmus maximus]
MDPNVWSEGMYSSSNICLDGCTVEHLSSFQPDPVPSSDSDASGVSLTFHRDSENTAMLPESYYRGAGASLICSSPLELNLPRDSSTRRHPSPASSSCGHNDWNLSSGHQAKRARVENIIKGMTCSPDVTTNQHEQTDGSHESERIRELSLHQEHMEGSGSGSLSHSQTTRKQLDSEEEKTWSNSPNTSPRDTFEDSHREFESSSGRKHQGWKKVKLLSYFQSRPERIKLMADVLKYELSRAVSRSVDSVFKSMQLLQASPDNESVETEVPLQSSGSNEKKIRLSFGGNAEVQVPDVQTEALSLVVQKPRLERSDKLILQPRSRAHHRPKPPASFSHDPALCNDQPSQKTDNPARQHALRWLRDGGSEAGQAKFEMFDAHWTSVKVRSKVNSRSARSPLPRSASVDPRLVESLRFPHVKIESDSLVKNNLYMLNEGLTTNHLKKAKLMFFYTRYPSSLVLKMCFHDVQFTRCITSQLIKWFSNFREFYYIQIEKFARHALAEGVADVRGLTVGRESELFRSLNMHYNKANDFQVPDRFLEVAEVTQREFYIAISMGKDRDPSWKKAIYKVICKLDSDMPTEFKSHHSG